MRRIFVFLAALLLCFSMITTAYAAVVPFDNTQWLELPSGFGGGSHVYPQSTVVSYSTLQSIRSQVKYVACTRSVCRFRRYGCACI